MRILHIINSLNTGGAEKLIVDTLPLYNKNKIKTDLLLLKKSDTILSKQIEGNLNVFSINAKSYYNFSNIFKLKKIIGEYDIIHAHLFPTLYLLAFCKFLFYPNKMIIFTEHSTNNKRRDKFYLRWIEKFIYSQYNKIICISKGTEITLLKHIGNNYKGKLITIDNGIDLSIFKPNELQPNLRKKEKIVLTQVSSFRYPKDQDTIIRSLKLLPENVIVQLAGSGPRLDECKKLAKQLNLQDRVSFLGQRSDIPEILHNTDVCIMSSFYEGFGLSAVEAMACKKPIIASNVEGLKEIVEGFGTLFDVENEKQLAAAILKLINDNDYYNQVAESCYKRSKDYDINTMVANYVAVYKNELINKL